MRHELTALLSSPLTVLALVSLVACDGDPAGPGGAGQPIVFDWSGTIAQGDMIEIKGVQGDITATGSAAGQVEVRASKTGQDDDPAAVSIEVLPHAGGVTICAVYPDVPGQQPNVCLPGNQGNLSVQNNDVQVNFTVTVPAGVVFEGRTISGGIMGIGLQSEAFATTISGGITLHTTEIAEASTTSGAIDVSMGRADFGRSLAFTVISGNIDVEVPSNTNALVDLRTVSGVVSSDFPLSGSPIHLQGTLGTGGPVLSLAAVSGNVRLRSGPSS